MRIYCPIVGECPYQPVTVIQNSFFLIEPFNEEKDEREKIIEDALKEVFGPNNYKLLTSEREISNGGIYCDICRKIASSEYCITDLTAERIENKLIIRPNVALELGMAFGMHKASIILSKKNGDERLIPSDINFIRYIDIPFDNWLSLKQRIIETLEYICIGKIQAIPIPVSMQKMILQTINEIKTFIKSFESHESIYYNCKIIKYTYNIRREVIAIVSNARFLEPSMKLSILQIDDGIEKEIGALECWHIQSIEDISQCICYSTEESKPIWREIEETIIREGYCSAVNNRLKPIIPKMFSKNDMILLKEQLKLFDKLAEVKI